MNVNGELIMKKVLKISYGFLCLSVLIFNSTLAQNVSKDSTKKLISFRDRLLPAPVNGGFKLKDYWVWCGSVIKGEDGKYHMFASRWPKGLSFSPHWLTNSEVVHAIADKPEGPYQFYEVALLPRGEQFWDGKMTHNPTIHKYGDTYLLYYTGTTYKGPMPTPENPTSETSDLKLEAHYHERIGLATSKSVYGPWIRYDKPILDVRKGKWDSLIVSNAAPIILPDGKVMLFYKGVSQLRHHAIAVAVADNFMGPYKRLTDEPFDIGVDAEDPTIWYENGKYHALMLDTGQKYSKKEIFYCTSDDLLHWKVDVNPIAITKNILWDDGIYRTMTNTERPQILVQKGKATHVFIATGFKEDGGRSTWNMVIPLKPMDSH